MLQTLCNDSGPFFATVGEKDVPIPLVKFKVDMNQTGPSLSIILSTRGMG